MSTDPHPRPISSKDIGRCLTALLRQRGVDKTLCPSEVARQLAEKDWRPLMPRVREVATRMADRGDVVATQQGRPVWIPLTKGPIRLRRRTETRDPETPCKKLLNIGPVVSEELRSHGIDTLDELRKIGATETFTRVMLRRWHEGHRRGVFHAMYLQAIYGALHDANCIELDQPLRDHLRELARIIRRDCVGTE